MPQSGAIVYGFVRRKNAKLAFESVKQRALKGFDKNRLTIEMKEKLKPRAPACLDPHGRGRPRPPPHGVKCYVLIL